jgi:hypothetical protein
MSINLSKRASCRAAKTFGGHSIFKAAGVYAFALHGAAFGQTNTPEVQSVPPSAWQAHNRSVLAGFDFLNRHYTEFDSLGLTQDGILDTEKGTLKGGTIRGRWQGTPFGEVRHEIYLQGEYRQHTGSTSYQGYLQSGATLTPYSATTQNELHDFCVRIGIPLTQTESVQWVPFVEYRYQNWVRDLVQYRETFQHHAGVIGVFGQWRVSPAWTIEGEAGAGSTLRARIDVPQLGFSATLPNRALWTLGTSASVQIKYHWSVVASIRHEQSAYGQSAASNGMFEPASRTRQTNMLFGIEYQL